MSLSDHIGVGFFALVLTLPLFRSGLGEMHLQNVIWLIYILGLIAPLLLIKKTNIRVISAPDILLLLFVFLYVMTVVYTISNDYRAKLLLMAIMPLYYFNSKLVVQRDLLDLMMKYVMFIFLAFSVYLLIWLAKVGFQYNIYLDYTDALFKVAYLTPTIYSVVLVLFLTTKPKITLIGVALTFYFSFITFISGSRFSILFLVVALVIIMLPSMKKVSKVTVKGALISLFVLIVLVPSLVYYNQQHDLSAYFSYTTHRFMSMLHGDASITGRIELINRTLSETNSSTFLGSGIGSSIDILGSNYAHNMVLEAWLESGLINATLLVVILVYGAYMGFKSIRKGGLGLFIGLSYYYLALSHMKSFSVTDSRMLIVFYGALVAGALMTVKRKRNTVSADESAPINSRNNQSILSSSLNRRKSCPAKPNPKPWPAIGNNKLKRGSHQDKHNKPTARPTS